MNEPKKNLSLLHSWELYSSSLPVEFRQSTEEGKDVESYRILMESVDKLPVSQEKEDLADAIFRLICSAPQRADYPYEEPSDLEGIRALRDGYTVTGARPKGAELKQKLTGAWEGRVIGCMLGKPVEGVKTPGIRKFFQATGNWPIRRYALSTDNTPELIETNDVGRRLNETGWYPDLISYAPFDDDTNYTVLAAQVIEKYGRGFTPDDVRKCWELLQPKTSYCTAERVAIRNFNLGYFPPDSAVYKNPYRQWIGAQMRGDYFGYVNPGDPETAADMAWRDASISHVKNGIYGEMFIAAAIAAAAVTDDAEAALRAGLGQIPKTSRLYEAVMKVIDSRKRGVTAEAFFADLHRRWNEYDPHDWCHTISNAEIVSACLLYCGDFDSCIGTAVEQGFDTDCNGATAGSIFGMLRGAGAIDDRWVAPIHGTVDTTITGVGCTTVEGLVEQMLRHMA